MLIVISQTPFQIGQHLNRWQLLYWVFLLYRIALSSGVCIFIYFYENSVDLMILWVFGALCMFVHLSIMLLYTLKVVRPLQGSIHRTVNQMIKNDLIKDVQELELFGSLVNTRKISLFRHKNNESLWLRACKAVSVETMKYLLKIDPNIDVNEADSAHKRTPIIYASMEGNIDAIKLLLNQPGINLNHCDNNGCSALLYALEMEHHDTITQLIQYGADINAFVNDLNETHLMIAMRQGKIDIVRLMLNNGISYQLDTTIRNSNGNTAWIYCWEDVTIMKAYVKYHIDNQIQMDINEIDLDSHTALMKAIFKQNSALVEYLFSIKLAMGLNTSIKDSNGRTSWYYCWETRNWSIIEAYERYHKKYNIPFDRVENGIPRMDVMNACQQGDFPLARYILRHSEEYKVDTNIFDENGQTPWVYCWKSNNVELMIEYIQFHKTNNIQWNIFEPNLKKTSNALIYNFSKMFSNSTAKFTLRKQVILFKLLVYSFVDEFILCRQQEGRQFEWPKESCGTFLTWLFSPLRAAKSVKETKAWRGRMGAPFYVVLEVIAVILYKVNNLTPTEMEVIKTINEMRWIYFLDPFNSVTCLKYFVECIVDQTNSIQIENVNQMAYDDDTIVITFATAMIFQESDSLFRNKCDIIMKWLRYEFGISKDSIVKLINIRDRMFNATAISLAMRNENYYFAKLILQTFKNKVNIVDEYYYQYRKSDPRSSPWLEIISSKQTELIQLAVGAMLSNAYDNDVDGSVAAQLANISTTDLIKLDGKHDFTPLFWAVNHGLFAILQSMLQQQAKNTNINILNVSATDALNNSIWEYVSGLPNIYKLQLGAKKRIDFSFSTDDIDIVSMKKLIEQHEIDVNRLDSFGKQALYRVCNMEYDKQNFDAQFDKQYQVVKLLFENDATIFTNNTTENECAEAWRKVLLLAKDKKFDIHEVATVKQCIIAAFSNMDK